MGLLPESEAVQQRDRAQVARVGGREYAVFLQVHEQVVQDGSNRFGGMAAVLRVRREREPELHLARITLQDVNTDVSEKEASAVPGARRVERNRDHPSSGGRRLGARENDREFDSVIRMGFDAAGET